MSNIAKEINELKKETISLIKNTIEEFKKNNKERLKEVEVDENYIVGWGVIDEFSNLLDRRLEEYAKSIGLKDAFFEDYDVIFEVNDEDTIIFKNILEEFIWG